MSCTRLCFYVNILTIFSIDYKKVHRKHFFDVIWYRIFIISFLIKKGIFFYMLRNWKNKKKGPSWIFKQHFQSSDPCFRFSYFAIWTKMTWKILVDKKWYFMHYWFVKEHQNSKSGRGIDWSSRSREVGGEGDKKKTRY